MKTRIFLATAAILPCLFLQNANARYPFMVIKDAQKSPLIKHNILYQSGSTLLVKTDSAEKSDFINLYVAQLSFDVEKSEIAQFVDVIHFEKGKFAVVHGEQDNIAALSAMLHNRGLACGVMTLLTGTPIAEAVRATAIPKIDINEKNTTVKQLLQQVSTSNLERNVTDISSIHTRYHNSETGTGVASFLMEKYQNIAKNRDDVDINLFQHTNTPQASLIVRIMGKTNPDEIVVLGSHIDSINYLGPKTQRAPGADDNASGTATNLEIFRILMDNHIRPNRTLEIHGYAAEEIGLVGSQEVAENYSAANKNVVAMMQFDMNLFTKNNGPAKIWFVTSNTDIKLNNMLGTLVTNYIGVPWEMQYLRGGDSDHSSWRRNGYSTAFPFENPRAYNDFIHTAKDDIANSGNFEQTKAFAQLGLSYASHFAGIAQTE